MQNPPISHEKLIFPNIMSQIHPFHNKPLSMMAISIIHTKTALLVFDEDKTLSFHITPLKGRRRREYTYVYVFIFD